MAKKEKNLYWGQIFDTLYGFVRLTKTEEQIINSPYYQRLRWIKQLGFANYIFPGAEHTRFAHAIGALHCADQMIRSIGKHVSDDRLFNVKVLDKATLFHKSCRIAALLHDIGTFPFSHSIEESYIRFGQELEKSGKLPGKKLPNNHEHLGSFLIKNTDHAHGITRILHEAGIESAVLSKFIKGNSEEMVANQLLHSDLDADRMDYLVRDAHYTGIKYGQIDRDYIFYHLTTVKTPQGKEILAVGEKAIHAVEDFLLARFAWYSQVVKNSSSAKYDILAGHIALYLLRNGHALRFHELLKMIKHDPERFYGFNDTYFMGLLQRLYLEKKIKDPKIIEKVRMLLFRIPPHTVKLPEFEHQFLKQRIDFSIPSERELLVEKLKEKVQEIEMLFKTKGKGTEWILADIPSRDVYFSKGKALGTQKNAIKLQEKKLMDRDPVKVLRSDSTVSLLEEQKNSIIGRLSSYVNFIPNVYVNDSGLELLKRHLNPLQKNNGRAK